LEVFWRLLVVLLISEDSSAIRASRAAFCWCVMHPFDFLFEKVRCLDS
jgi:hypothetical protein